MCIAHLDVSRNLICCQLLRQLLHRWLTGDELAHNKMQQRRAAICALHICQLQERVQLETCTQGLSIATPSESKRCSKPFEVTHAFLSSANLQPKGFDSNSRVGRITTHHLGMRLGCNTCAIRSFSNVLSRSGV